MEMAQAYLAEAIKGMILYCKYPFDDATKEYNYWLALSTAYHQRLQIFLKQSDKGPVLSEESLCWVHEGLKAVDKALKYKECSELHFRKWNFLQCLADSGNHPPEDPIIWSKKYLDSHPQPHSTEYLKYAQLHGGELAKRGKLEEARLFFESLLKVKEDPITFLCLGKVLDHMNNVPAALQAFQQASILDPSSIEIKLWLVSQQVKAAIRSFREEGHPPSQVEIEEWVQISNAFCSAFSENEALFAGETSTFIPLKELAEHLYMTHLPKIANVLVRLQQYPFALGLYECILKNVRIYLKADIFEITEVINIHVVIGGLYAVLGESEKGEPFLLQAIEWDEKRLSSYSNLTEIYAAQKDEKKLSNLWAQLSPLFSKAIGQEQRQQFSTPLFNFGAAYTCLMKDLDDPAYGKAQEFYKWSLECDPDNWDARYSLARLLAIKDDASYWKEAKGCLDGLEAFEKALPFGLEPMRKFQLYFCYAGILALCNEIPAARKMAIEASRAHYNLDEIRRLQSYLDNHKKVDSKEFCREVIISIRKLQFDFPVGKLIHPNPLSIPEGSFIGYHGTIDLNCDNFKEGVKPYAAEKRQFAGKGFYTTEDKEAASYFAMKKCKDEGRGKPILLKVYNSNQKTLVGQKVPPRQKVKGSTLIHYNFIQAPIDGLEAFSQHYFSENILKELKVDVEHQEVNWTEKQYEAFIKKWFRMSC